MKKTNYQQANPPFSLPFQSVSLTPDLQKVIRGTIQDQNGTPLPGVTVSIKGKPTHTTTDENGRYTLDRVTGGKDVGFSLYEK